MTKLIVALDTDIEIAKNIVKILPAEDCIHYKIGPQLFFAKDGWEFTKKLCENHSVFLDLKLADTTRTNKKTVKLLCSSIGPWLISTRNEIVLPPIELYNIKNNIFTQLAHVPQLTDEQQIMVDIRHQYVVCNGNMASTYKTCRPKLLTIVPGYRMWDDEVDDHKLCDYEFKMINYLVVGKPIVEAKKPLDAYNKYMNHLRMYEKL